MMCSLVVSSVVELSVGSWHLTALDLEVSQCYWDYATTMAMVEQSSLPGIVDEMPAMLSMGPTSDYLPVLYHFHY